MTLKPGGGGTVGMGGGREGATAGVGGIATPDVALPDGTAPPARVISTSSAAATKSRDLRMVWSFLAAVSFQPSAFSRQQSAVSSLRLLIAVSSGDAH